MTPPPWPQRIVVGSTGMMQKESPDQKANGLRQLGLWRLKAGAMALPLVAPPVSAPSSPTATVKPRVEWGRWRRHLRADLCSAG